jgi:hypothetical protein
MPPCTSDVVNRDLELSRGVRDALADPIVQALLAADRVDPQEVRIWHGAWLPGFPHEPNAGSEGTKTRVKYGFIRSWVIPGAMEATPWRNRPKRW